MITANIDAFLAACAEPEVHRIALIEAPAARGWERWREICFRHGVGNVEMALQALIDAGLVAAQLVRPLAHVVAGALDEAALYAARATDRERATRDVRRALIARWRAVETMTRPSPQPPREVPASRLALSSKAPGP